MHPNDHQIFSSCDKNVISLDTEAPCQSMVCSLMRNAGSRQKKVDYFAGRSYSHWIRKSTTPMPEPRQHARNERYFSEELEWMQLKTSSPDQLPQAVEEWVLMKPLHVLEIPTQFPMFHLRSQNKLRETQLPRKEEAEKLEFESWLDFRIFRMWRMRLSGVKYLGRLKQLYGSTRLNPRRLLPI